MSEALTTTQSEGGNKVSAFVRREIGRVAALASLVIIFTFFTIMRPVFASWANVSGGILMSTTVIGLLAIGVTFVIITGGIDLSVGTSMASRHLVLYQQSACHAFGLSGAERNQRNQ